MPCDECQEHKNNSDYLLKRMVILSKEFHSRGSMRKGSKFSIVWAFAAGFMSSVLLTGCKESSAAPEIIPDIQMNAYYQSRLDLFATYHHEDVAMIGDSLTAQGDWEALLGRPVLNFGIESDNSRSLLIRLDQVILFRPKVVFILIGTNEYKNAYLWSDLKAIRQKLLDNGIRAILTTIPYKNEPDTEYSMKNRETAIFNQQIRIAGLNQGMEYIDLNTPTACGELLCEDMTTDNVHLNAKGYQVWADLIKKKLG